LNTTSFQESQDRIIELTTQLRSMVKATRDQSVVGVVGQAKLRHIKRRIDEVIVEWDAIVASGGAGLVQYVKDQNQNQTINLGAEYNATKNAAQAVANWIDANIPAEATYDTAFMAGYRAVADAFEATLTP
jgi:hypothetical protein